MEKHKFAVGQTVISIGVSSPVSFGRSFVTMPAGAYDIMRHMPAVDGELQYRVRSAADGRERLVLERDLRA